MKRKLMQNQDKLGYSMRCVALCIVSSIRTPVFELAFNQERYVFDRGRVATCKSFQEASSSCVQGHVSKRSSLIYVYTQSRSAYCRELIELCHSIKTVAIAMTLRACVSHGREWVSEVTCHEGDVSELLRNALIKEKKTSL